MQQWKNSLGNWKVYMDSSQYEHIKKLLVCWNKSEVYILSIDNFMSLFLDILLIMWFTK